MISQHEGLLEEDKVVRPPAANVVKTDTALHLLAAPRVSHLCHRRETTVIR